MDMGGQVRAICIQTMLFVDKEVRKGIIISTCKDYYLIPMTKMDGLLARYENPSHTVYSEAKRVTESNNKVIGS